MAAKTFDKETLLDLTVNFIPLFIISFFIVGFAVFSPWGLDFGDLGTIMQYVLLLFPFIGLSILTYISGKAIAGTEEEEEEADAEAIETTDDAESAPTVADANGVSDDDAASDADEDNA
ncbi:MAG: DUF6684 family protein [Halolamina sp.]